ncbi:MAG: hypothetical protein JW720_13645 [Sedimentisphaerales bacterium]|nr:hypothetical protein [Sedimentisphaerales bacterium]
MKRIVCTAILLFLVCALLLTLVTYRFAAAHNVMVRTEMSKLQPIPGLEQTPLLDLKIKAGQSDLEGRLGSLLILAIVNMLIGSGVVISLLKRNIQPVPAAS